MDKQNRLKDRRRVSAPPWKSWVSDGAGRSEPGECEYLPGLSFRLVREGNYQVHEAGIGELYRTVGVMVGKGK